MATTTDLANVLAEKAGADAEVISICVKRLCEAGLLPTDPGAPVNASHASHLLLSVMTMPLGYAPAAAVALCGGLPMNDAKYTPTPDMRSPMSAFPMISSALPPIADIPDRPANVRY